MTVSCSRREFLTAVTASVAVGGAAARGQGERPTELIDTHTHFYDPTRPQGVPWPAKTDTALYRPVYPAEFKALAQPLGVTGTVVVEASPWLDDNQWSLDLVHRDPFLLGLVGNLRPGRPEFAAELARFAANPRFLGIRVHAADLPPGADNADVLRDLKMIADRDRAIDVLINTDRLLDVAKLAATLPGLRVVIDHCANVRIDGGPPPGAWVSGLRACAPLRNVFMKVSGLVEGARRPAGSTTSDAAFYKPALDAVWDAFGEDRVVYGGNWPVSAPFAPYAAMFGIVRDYFGAKGRTASDKYFAANAHRAYKWPRR